MKKGKFPAERNLMTRQSIADMPVGKGIKVQAKIFEILTHERERIKMRMMRCMNTDIDRARVCRPRILYLQVISSLAL
jgi:hypothetical protein